MLDISKEPIPPIKSYAAGMMICEGNSMAQ